MVNMVNFANNGAKLISTTVNEKTGTTIKKFTIPKTRMEKALATVVEYGQNTPLKKRGIDAFVKFEGKDNVYGTLDRALFHGDKIILSGASKPENFKSFGSFNERFKQMIDSLKADSKLTAEQIPNTKREAHGHGFLGSTCMSWLDWNI